MLTRLTRSPEEAAAVLRRGGRVVFPTETVYGLGADAFNASAVRGLFEAKGRPADNPLIVHVAAPEAVETLARDVPPAAQSLMERFFPGPLTLVLPRHPSVPAVVTAGLDTVGVRMPRLPLARRFLEACQTPVAAPSANRSGRPSSTTWQAARDDLDGRVEAILQGQPAEAGLESTVVDCTAGERLVVLRAGTTTLEALRNALPGVEIAPPEGSSEKDPSEKGDAPARSPGTRHRHYAPKARVVIVERPPGPQADEEGQRAYIGLQAPADPGAFGLVRVCPGLEAYARALFAFFREADAAGCVVICAQRVEEDGLGRALMDRLSRASDASSETASGTPPRAPR